MSVEICCYDAYTENRKYWEKNLSQCHFVDHKSHTDCDDRKPVPNLTKKLTGLFRGDRPETNCLSHGSLQPIKCHCGSQYPPGEPVTVMALGLFANGRRPIVPSRTKDRQQTAEKLSDGIGKGSREIDKPSAELYKWLATAGVI